MPVVLKYEIFYNTRVLQRKREYISVSLTHGRFHNEEVCNAILKISRSSLKKNENVCKENGSVWGWGGCCRDQNDDE